ncbi:MAG: MlaD family protein [Planctomycetota bacterium]
MNSSNPAPPSPGELPKVVVRARRGISIVWLVPLVAVGIGLWLLYQSVSARGVTVSITFADARGLEAGKTRVKFRSLEVGLVKTVRLQDDLREIVVEAEIDRSFEPHLTTNTKFWVARPRFGTAGISDLETYLSGTYLAIDPAPGAPSRLFEGLDRPVPSSHADRGLRLVLLADRLGSLRVGSPVRYLDFEVGEVEAYEILEDNRRVKVDLFIQDGYSDLVRTSSRFWNASGVEVKVGSDGLSLKAESLAAILGGAIAFDTDDGNPGDRCKSGHQFHLYGKRADVGQPKITSSITYLMTFKSSPRGLKAGAPVEYQGMQIGKVKDVGAVLDRQRGEIRIPVLVDLELERLHEFEPCDVSDEEVIESLVGKGMRAQLRSGYIVTGQQYVDLDFYRDAPAASIVPTVPYPTFPTVESQLDRFQAVAMDTFDRLRALPLKELAETGQKALADFDNLVSSPDMISSVKSLNETLVKVGDLAVRIDGKVDLLAGSMEQVALRASSTLEDARAFLTQMRESVGDESPLRFEIDRVLAEIHGATRSIRGLADTLERDPNALIFGKKPAGGSK